MQEVIQLKHLAELLPSAEKRDKQVISAANKECITLVQGLERVDSVQSVLILKGLPVLSEIDTKWVIENIAKKSLYSPARKSIPTIETFSVEPFLELGSTTLSETSRTGGFHSDFWSAFMPPKYIWLQCIKPDPRHPYFGRNQYARISLILQKINENFGEDVKNKALNYLLKYKNGEFHFFSNEIARFHEHLAFDEPLSNDVNFCTAIREIALSECVDFALNEGEIGIFNNHKGLHRRGEATVDFVAKNNFYSRCLRTVRFI